MSFKKCTWKAEPTHDVEYDDLKTGNRFVTLETKEKTVREIVQEKGPSYGRYKNTVYKKDFLNVEYPGKDVNEITVLAKEKEKYFLVVNHTLGRANPVLKEKFEEFYTPSSSAKPGKGDKGILPGKPRGPNPHQNKKQKAKNKELAVGVKSCLGLAVF